MEVRIIEKENALLGLRIFTLAHKQGLSINQLAKQSGVTLSTVQRICAGEATNPSVWSIASLAEVLDVSLDYLVYGEHREAPRQ